MRTSVRHQQPRLFRVRAVAAKLAHSGLFAIITAFAAIFSIAAQPIALAQDDSKWSGVIERKRKAVVKITVEYKTPGSSETISDQGSGIFISPNGHILTAKHVVKDRPGFNRFIKVFPIRDSSLFYEAIIVKHIIVKQMKDADVAVLQVAPDAGTFYLSIGESLSIRETDTAHYMGFPKGSWSAAFGTVSNVARGGFWRLEQSSGQGASGGPVIDVCGTVVGLVIQGETERTEVLPEARFYQEIAEYLPTRNKTKCENGKAETGMTLEERERILLDEIDLINPEEYRACLAEERAKNIIRGLWMEKQCTTHIRTSKRQGRQIDVDVEPEFANLFLHRYRQRANKLNREGAKRIAALFGEPEFRDYLTLMRLQVIVFKREHADTASREVMARMGIPAPPRDGCSIDSLTPGPINFGREDLPLRLAEARRLVSAFNSQALAKGLLRQMPSVSKDSRAVMDQKLKAYMPLYERQFVRILADHNTANDLSRLADYYTSGGGKKLLSMIAKFTTELVPSELESDAALRAEAIEICKMLTSRD